MDNLSEFTKEIVEALKIAESNGSQGPVVFKVDDTESDLVGEAINHLTNWGYDPKIDAGNSNIIIQPKKNQSFD